MLEVARLLARDGKARRGILAFRSEPRKDAAGSTDARITPGASCTSATSCTSTWTTGARGA
jgi:hypothetical protein